MKNIIFSSKPYKMGKNTACLVDTNNSMGIEEVKKSIYPSNKEKKAQE